MHILHNGLLYSFSCDELLLGIYMYTMLHGILVCGMQYTCTCGQAFHLLACTGFHTGFFVRGKNQSLVTQCVEYTPQKLF